MKIDFTQDELQLIKDVLGPRPTGDGYVNGKFVIGANYRAYTKAVDGLDAYRKLAAKQDKLKSLRAEVAALEKELS